MRWGCGNKPPPRPSVWLCLLVKEDMRGKGLRLHRRAPHGERSLRPSLFEMAAMRAERSGGFESCPLAKFFEWLPEGTTRLVQAFVRFKISCQKMSCVCVCVSLTSYDLGHNYSGCESTARGRCFFCRRRRQRQAEASGEMSPAAQNSFFTRLRP